MRARLTKLLLSVVVAVLGALSVAHAQDAPQTFESPAPATTNMSLEKAKDAAVASLKSLMAAFTSPIAALEAKLRPNGKYLVLTLVILNIGYAGIRLAGGTTDAFDLFVTGIKVSMVGSLCLAAVEPQQWLADATNIGGGPITLFRAIEVGFEKVLAMALAGSKIPASADGMLLSVSQASLGAINEMVKLDIIPKGLTDAWQLFTHLAGLIVGLLAWAASVLAFVLAAATIVGEILVAKLSIDIAKAFTGLMVPWLLFQPMKFLFDAWLRTVLVGFVALVIAGLFATGMATFATHAADVYQRLPAESAKDLSNIGLAILYVPMLLGSIVILTLVGKVNSIAQSLFSGSIDSGIGLGSFLRSANMTAGTVGKGAYSGSQAALGAARVAPNASRTGLNTVGSAMRRGGLALEKAGGQGSMMAAVGASLNHAGKNVGRKETVGSIVSRESAKKESLNPTARQMKVATKAADAAYASARFAGMDKASSQVEAIKAAQTALRVAPAAQKTPRTATAPSWKTLGDSA